MTKGTVVSFQNARDGTGDSASPRSLARAKKTPGNGDCFEPSGEITMSQSNPRTRVSFDLSGMKPTALHIDRTNTDFDENKPPSPKASVECAKSDVTTPGLGMCIIESAHTGDAVKTRKEFHASETPADKTLPASKDSIFPFVTPCTIAPAKNVPKDAVDPDEELKDSSLCGPVYTPARFMVDKQGFEASESHIESGRDIARDEGATEDQLPPSLYDAVSCGFMMTLPKDCLRYGVSNITLDINSTNAPKVRFDPTTQAPCCFCESSLEALQNSIGSLFDYRKELVKLGCNDNLIKDKWISIHIRWVSQRRNGRYWTA